MEDHGILKRFFGWVPWKSALIGAALYGPLPSLVYYYDYFYGPKSGHGGRAFFITQVLAIPNLAFEGVIGLRDTAFYRVVTESGWGRLLWFFENALFGAAAFMLIAFFARSLLASRKLA